jgi:hypothetical protein
LSAADQTIISGIGSAYTGNGTNNGHNLTYALVAGSGLAVYGHMQIYMTISNYFSYCYLYNI